MKKKDLSIVHLKRENEWLKLGIEIFPNGNKAFDSIIDLYQRDQSRLNPYHNPQHMMAVAIRADKLFMDFKEGFYKNATRMNFNRKCLFLAASLHDIGHFGSRFSDHINIATAEKVILENLACKSVLPYIDEIIDLVRCTEFPFIRVPITLAQMCLRDADLMMCLEPDWPHFFQGLKKETGKNDITEQDNIEFLKKQTFYSTPAQELMYDFFKNN